MALQLWTIGHSTRPIDEFLALLKAHGIQQVVDVRTVPKSRHNPQFNTDQLGKSLNKTGLAYQHMPQLGGLRKAKKGSLNTGWRSASFRGYADYMQTDEFNSALEELMTDGRSHTTAIMCAEAVPWRCHRSLIADALMSRGWTVLDIMTEQRATPHTLTPFAKVGNGRVTYPSPAEEETPRLFQ
jgi:uncharacterized protein (DUF488 family)